MPNTTTQKDNESILAPIGKPYNLTLIRELPKQYKTFPGDISHLDGLNELEKAVVCAIANTGELPLKKILDIVTFVYCSYEETLNAMVQYNILKRKERLDEKLDEVDVRKKLEKIEKYGSITHIGELYDLRAAIGKDRTILLKKLSNKKAQSKPLLDKKIVDGQKIYFLNPNL